jgi:hypothetical protein
MWFCLLCTAVGISLLFVLFASFPYDPVCVSCTQYVLSESCVVFVASCVPCVHFVSSAKCSCCLTYVILWTIFTFYFICLYVVFVSFVVFISSNSFYGILCFTRLTFQRYVLPLSLWMSVDNYFTRQYSPEDNSELHTRRHENFKSQIIWCLCVWTIWL